MNKRCISCFLSKKDIEPCYWCVNHEFYDGVTFATLFLSSLALYIQYIYYFPPSLPHPSIYSPAYRRWWWWGVVSMDRVEELNVSHVAFWKWRSEGSGVTCSHATCPALSTGNLHFVVFSFTLSFWMLHGTSPGERSCPTTGPATGATSPFHSVVVHHSGLNLLHCCYGHQLELDKKRPFRCSARVTRARWCHPIKLLRADHFGWLFLLLSSRVDFFFIPLPPHLGLHLCNGAHQSYFQFGSLVLGSPPIWFMHSCRFIVSMNW